MSGTPGRGELEERHPERHAVALLRQALCVLAELHVVEQAGREALGTFLPLVILVDPVRVHLRLAQRLLQVEPEPVRRRAARRRRRSAGSGTPRSDRASPRSAAARRAPTRPGSAAMQARRARTSAASLRVVGRRREQAAGRAREVRLVEALDREREAAGVAADLVQRDEAVPAVEGRVLDALGVHGRRRLLEADDERVVPALLEQEDPRQLLRQARLLDRGAVVVGRRAPASGST